MISALSRALPVFFSVRILSVVFLPLAGAAFVFVVVSGWTWTPFTQWLAAAVFDVPRGSGEMPAGWQGLAAAVTAFLAYMAAAVVTALIAIAVLAMPVVVRVVAARDYPTLERRRGGTFAGSLVNAIVVVAVFAPLWLASLALLAFPPLFVAASLLLSAWLNQRLLRYDALAEHADADEMRAVVRALRGRLMGLGLLIAPLGLVPVVNLFAPLYAGVAFTYLCLDALAALRGQAGSE